LKKSANAFFINAVTIEARTQKTIEQGSRTKEGAKAFLFYYFNTQKND